MSRLRDVDPAHDGEQVRRKCAPCGLGFRASLQESERLRDAERADPIALLFQQVMQRYCDDGGRALTADERTFYAVVVMLSDLERGAFPLFFDSADEEVQSAAESGLRALGFAHLIPARIGPS
ncbi:MAG: hypothetical protein RIT81_32140 [Deltaproteobacteria bacterium]